MHAHILAQAKLPDATSDGIEKVKQWAVERVLNAEQDFQYEWGTRFDSPHFWGDEIVYKIQVDRFNASSLSPSNAWDDLNTDLKEIPNLQHGGNLKGISERLDYLSDLGVTTILLTPVLKHDGSYHGYCTTDFTQIDPGFGSNEDFRELVFKAHKKGIKVIMDIVINHMCDPMTNYKTWPNHIDCANELESKNWRGEPGGSISQGILAWGPNFFPPLKHQEFFNRCGANADSEMRGQESASVHGDFVNGMFDFNTRNWDFQDIFTKLHTYWIAYADIDGFRLDAAKHVTSDFIAYFSTTTRRYAAELGKDNFYIVGEVAASEDWIGQRLGVMMSNPFNPDDHGIVPATMTYRLWTLKDHYLAHPTQKFPGMTAAYDFAHSGIARDILRAQTNLTSLANYFSSSYYLTLKGQADPRINFTLLEIHDWPRFVAGHHKNNPWKSKLGAGYLLTTSGIPLIYYGQEQGFNGDCHYHTMEVGEAAQHIKDFCHSHDHALNRQDMFLSGPWRLGSTVESINKLTYIGRPKKYHSLHWQKDPYLDRSNMVYKEFRKLNYVRRSCRALRQGQTYFRHVEDGNEGLLAFSRIEGDSEILVVVNTTSYGRQLDKIRIDHMINGSAGVYFKNLLSDQRAVVVKEGSGVYLDFQGARLDGNSVAIMVHEANVSPWIASIESHLCNDSPVSSLAAAIP